MGQEAHAFVTELVRIERCRQGVIRGDRTKGCYTPCALAGRLVQQVLELTHLVTAVEFAREVVAFDRDCMSLAAKAQCVVIDRRRQFRERQPWNLTCQTWKRVRNGLAHCSHSIENQFRIETTSD